ncbi:MAG TPA: DUF3857 domain-containing protein [Bacteroidales bacterium]|nr:DUF3857 domain-containing protein [Bacteroidales bacterium]
MLEKHEKVKINNHTRETYTELLLQVNSREGEKWASFELFFSPQSPIRKLNAWIQDTSGRIIRKLDKKEIHDRSAFFYGSFYSDGMLRCFDFRFNQYPYQIHVDYTQDADQFMLISRWSPVFDLNIPTFHASLTMEVPTGYLVSVFSQGILPAMTDTVDEMIRYTWKGGYSRVLKTQAWSPPIKDLVPGVVVVPLNFKYGIAGSMASWEEFGAYLDRLNNPLEDLPPEETLRVGELVRGIADTLERIRTLYRYIQENTHYLSVSIDIGGIKPYPVSFVARNKYGDCKALTLYMKSILASAGISSYYTIVQGGDRPEWIDRTFPSSHWFNHAILCIPIGGDTIWLDCTRRNGPVSLLSDYIQGRPALVVAGQRSRLCNIPMLSEDEVAKSTLIRITGTDGIKIKASVRIDSRGPGFEELLRISVCDDWERQKKMVTEQIPADDAELTSFTFTGSSGNSHEITMNADYRYPDRTRSVPGRIVIAVPPADLPEFEKSSNREQPVFLPHPIWHRDTLACEINWGEDVQIPPPTERSCEAGYYKISAYRQGTRVVYCREIKLHRGLYPMNQYPSLFAWVGSLRAYERQNKIIFNDIHE